MTPRKLLYLVTEDWFFLSYRLDVARAARDAGYDVIVATRVAKSGDLIKAEGFALEPLSWKRGSLNPFGLLLDTFAIFRLYRRLRPDIVHHVSLKPIILGSTAAFFLSKVAVVNSLTGFGYTFTAQTPHARRLANAVGKILGLLLRRRTTITLVENEDDRSFLVEYLRVPVEQIANLGGGVDLERFAPMPLPNATPVTVAC